MCRLPGSLAAWGTDRFPAALTAEVQSLGPQVLPLHRISTTGYPLETRLSVTFIAVQDTAEALQATVGVFFDEIVPGCSCGDEAEPQPAYGELSVTIDKTTGRALIEQAE